MSFPVILANVLASTTTLRYWVAWCCWKRFEVHSPQAEGHGSMDEKCWLNERI